LLFQAFSSVFLLASAADEALETPLRSSTAVSSARDGAPPWLSRPPPSRGGTELLLKTSRERSLCLGLDPFGSESIPDAMFLKGGEVRVSCDVLATEVGSPPARDVAPGGRSSSPDTGRAAILQIGGCSKESVPFDGDALLAETRRRQARASPVSKARGRNGSGRARGCGFNRHVTPGDFAVARLTRPRSHPPGTTSRSRAIGRAAAKSPLKEWLDLFGGDGGIDEMLARAPVTGMFGTAISVMKRRKRGCCRGGSERPQLDCGLVRPFAS